MGQIKLQTKTAIRKMSKKLQLRIVKSIKSKTECMTDLDNINLVWWFGFEDNFS